MKEILTALGITAVFLVGYYAATYSQIPTKEDYEQETTNYIKQLEI